MVRKFSEEFALNVCMSGRVKNEEGDR